MSLRGSNNIKIEGGMSSMTDLVFLLLIFFIILSALAKNAVDVDLPQGGGPSDQAQATSVMIDANNAITVNGKPTAIADAEMMILAAIDKDKVVELYADKKAEYGIAVQVIDIAKRNQLKIALMTQQ
jgi:biopolymer transport protein ExbD